MALPDASTEHTVVVTGASSGIGSELVRALAGPCRARRADVPGAAARRRRGLRRAARGGQRRGTTAVARGVRVAVASGAPPAAEGGGGVVGGVGGGRPIMQGRGGWRVVLMY